MLFPFLTGIYLIDTHLLGVYTGFAGELFYTAKTVSRQARQVRKGKTACSQAQVFYPIGLGLSIMFLNFFATFA